MSWGASTAGLVQRETLTKKEPQNTSTKWGTKAWDAYEYRARAPSLAQFDRDKSSRGSFASLTTSPTGLISVGPRNVKKTDYEFPQVLSRRKRHQANDGGNDRSSKSAKVNHLPEKNSETKVPLKAAGEWRGQGVAQEGQKSFHNK